MTTRTAFYNTASPYADTELYRAGLDVMQHRKIPKFASDELFEIPMEFHHRPDLLAYKLYGISSLWWVFAARNPSVLKDPLFHFTAGNKIFLSSKQTLASALGI